MATITHVPASPPLLTARDLLRLGGDVHRELWDGVLAVADQRCGIKSSAVAMAIAARVSRYVESHRSGWVSGENAGFIVRRSPDRVLSPDAAFVSRRRLPRMPSEGFCPMAPDLAVEVRSPRDSWLDVISRGGVWLGHGVRLVWCVDPEARRVAVLRFGREIELLGPLGVLSGAPVLPRLRIRVGEIFPGAPRRRRARP